MLNRSAYRGEHGTAADRAAASQTAAAGLAKPLGRLQSKATSGSSEGDGCAGLGTPGTSGQKTADAAAAGGEAVDSSLRRNSGRR